MHDLYNFYSFFNELYGRKNGPEVKIPKTNDDEPSLDDNLNSDITIDELDQAIQKLKQKKSVSTDLISNEMLIHSNSMLRHLILKLFNECLDKGVYPWNESVTTPLHKKGDKQNPDNYRAIAVGSCLGKLFANILLTRVISYRKVNNPDTPNQLGFCEGSQTSDHILTFSTMIDKHVKVKRNHVYTCFVDFRKAFDTVNRDALIYKLSHMGLKGRFISCIKDMYSKSTTRIKLIKKLSKRIDVLIGTEQGHPMSPEFFKIYIHDLSENLNDITSKIPQLCDQNITHLLWADDLVLTALDAKTLQVLLNALYQFCVSWGLEINVDKTKVMVFNFTGRLLKVNQSTPFKIGSQIILTTRTYCYLGIQFSLNGSFNVTQDELRRKAQRAFFSLKHTIDVNSLTVKSVLSLFDSLVLQILTYGIQVWFSQTKIASVLSGETATKQNIFLLDSMEKLHMQIIKWTLGVHKRSSTIGCYGETGRVPIGISAIPQVLRYFLNLELKTTNTDSSNTPLVVYAFKEQVASNLQWYKTLNNIRNLYSETESLPSIDTQTLLVRSKCYTLFLDYWYNEKSSQSKLDFYDCIKKEHGYEDYLSALPRTVRISVTRFRISAHNLNIERGRYNTMDFGERTLAKTCRTCMESNAKDQMLHELPFYEPIIEDEAHVLVTCPKYHHMRIKLPTELLNNLLRHEFLELMLNYSSSIQLGLFIKNICENRAN